MKKFLKNGAWLLYKWWVVWLWLIITMGVVSAWWLTLNTVTSGAWISAIAWNEIVWNLNRVTSMIRDVPIADDDLTDVKYVQNAIGDAGWAWGSLAWRMLLQSTTTVYQGALWWYVGADAKCQLEFGTDSRFASMQFAAIFNEVQPFYTGAGLYIDHWADLYKDPRTGEWQAYYNNDVGIKDKLTDCNIWFSHRWLHTGSA